MKRRYIVLFSLVLILFLIFACRDLGVKLNKRDQAIAKYNEAVDIHDQNPDSALQKYQEAKALDPDIGEVYLNIGLIYINRGEYDLGEEYTKTALSTFERTGQKISIEQTLERLKAICHNNLGVIYLRRAQDSNDKFIKQKFHQESLSYFKRAMEVDPTYEVAQNNYEINQTMDYDSTSTTPTENKDAGALYDEGVDYLDLKQYDNAITKFKEAIALDPSIGEAYLNIGLCYLNKGDYVQAERWSMDAVETFKKHKKVIAAGQTIEELIAICYLNTGLAYIYQAQDADKKGDSALAKELHKKALENFDIGIKEDPTYAHLRKIKLNFKTHISENYESNYCTKT